MLESLQLETKKDMTQTITIALIELIAISPIVFYFLKDKLDNKWKFIFLFVGTFVLNSFLIDLPRKISFLNLLGGQLNWTGKIFALTASLIIYFLIKKRFLNHYDFFKFSQARHSLKPNLIIILLSLLITVLSTRFLGGHSEFTLETLLFQLLPGIEEEIVFRGIMLGILLSIMKDKVIIGNKNFGNPSIYATAILFGLVHGLSFDNQWQIDFNFGYCFITILYGLVWGWIALKSKSILMPIIAHNLLNITIILIMALNTTANNL